MENAMISNVSGPLQGLAAVQRHRAEKERMGQRKKESAFEALFQGWYPEKLRYLEQSFLTMNGNNNYFFAKIRCND
jgi:hypothetical protein